MRVNRWAKNKLEFTLNIRCPPNSNIIDNIGKSYIWPAHNLNWRGPFWNGFEPPRPARSNSHNYPDDNWNHIRWMA